LSDADMHPFDQFAFLLMLVLESIFLLTMLFLTFRFFKQHKMPISQHYTWGIRMGLLIYCFAVTINILVHLSIFNGVGIQQTEEYLRVINQWDHPVGGLKLFYVMGIFSLQAFPLSSYYLFSKKREVIIFALVYFICMLVMFIMTLLKLPLQPF
jgi:hypothetical protein